jgi:hypothetical protein
LCNNNIFFSTFLVSCSPKLIPVENGKYSYFKKVSISYWEIDVELYDNDSIKITTNKGHHDRTCAGLMKRIKNNTYQITCSDIRDSSSSNFANLIQRFNIENDTIIYHKSYIKFWGVKLKRVPL